MGKVMDDIRMLINTMETANELKAVNDMVKARWGILQAKQLVEKASELAPGDHVRFIGRYGVPVGGVIEKFAQKNIVVRASDGKRWRVAPGLLEKVS
jgi:hypothetical protein